MPSPWITRSEAPSLPGPEHLPERAEVVVIGGGIAGLACAYLLARASVDVLLIESRARISAAWSGRNLGILSLGLLEHPGRLASALGMEQLAKLYRFSQESLSLAQEWLEVERSGGLWVSIMPGEEQDVVDGVAVLENLGIPVELWPAKEVNARLGSRNLGVGRFLPEELCLDPAWAAHKLCQAALEAGARIHTLSPLESASEEGALTLKVAGREVRAEAMIYATNAHLQTLDPAFEDKIYPVRFQALATAPAPPSNGIGCRGQHGYLAWRQAPDGSLLAGGCRWAVPHMEVGETDDTVVVDLVERRIRDFIERHLPVFAYEPVVQRWSGIMGFTCDGLPLIGPVPGQSRKLVCAGFNGLGASLAFRAAQAVTNGLLRGDDPGLPSLLRPGRFL